MMRTCPPFPESRSCTSVAWKLDEGKVEDANDEDGDLLVLRIMLLILQPSSLAPAGAMLGRPARATLPLRLSLRMVMVMMMIIIVIVRSRSRSRRRSRCRSSSTTMYYYYYCYYFYFFLLLLNCQIVAGIMKVIFQTAT
jgi:ABC-type xylose transport system permease subunit